jgi:DNA-binding winged helix-turn-helix (wHTH) protein
MIYCFLDYELDDRLYQLRRSNEAVEIEPKVFNILTYLLHHRDRVVAKDELKEELWPGQVISESALIYSIMAARKAVGDDGRRQQVIKTQHGRGYRFIVSLSAIPSVQRSTFKAKHV